MGSLEAAKKAYLEGAGDVSRDAGRLDPRITPADRLASVGFPQVEAVITHAKPDPNTHSKGRFTDPDADHEV